MFERFTDRARRIVVLAQEEARLLHHNYIGTEHLLLGVLDEAEGVGARVLRSFGITAEAVRDDVEDIIGLGGATPSGHIPFTPRAKKVLELSLRESLQLGHSYIGTEHVLLALLREGEGVAAAILFRLGVSLDGVRSRLSLAGEQAEEVVEAEEARPPRPTPVPSVVGACSFCGRELAEVDRFVAGPQGAICDRCVEAAARAVADAGPAVGPGSRRLTLPPRPG